MSDHPVISTRVKVARWILPQDVTELGAAELDARATALSSALKLHPVAARVLVSRGHDTALKATDFLADALSGLPDPFLMKGMGGAVERLAAAIAIQESVTLYGDYDVDGVSSTALLSTFLGQVGLNARTYIPHRIDEGYGLNLAAIERLAAEGTKLLITLDCGITAHAEILRAGELGLDVVVVDHHAVPDTMPAAVAVLNPLQPGCDYPTKWLCAGGVTFNLCMALRKLLRERGAFSERAEPNLKQLLDFVALATVADVVPLTGANRILVTHGLKELSEARRPGIRALKDVAGIEGQDVSASHVGFRLGPRINAAGRLDDASLGLQCLLAKDYESALPLARALDGANAERQLIEKSMLAQAIAQADAAVARGARGLVLASADWHPGIVGIVASRIVERHHRPTVMIALKDGIGKGSARSIDRFHLHDALSACASRFLRFGGHKAAAGLTIAEEQLDAFREDFERLALERLGPEDLEAKCRVDAVVDPRELDEAAVSALRAMAPFGFGNPEPTLALLGQRATSRVLSNKVAGEPGHLKLRLNGAPALDVIGFRQAPLAALAEEPVDLAFRVDVDEYRGERRLSLKVSALRSSR
jgi:single-stranded-DNA-specific exonuclease